MKKIFIVYDVNITGEKKLFMAFSTSQRESWSLTSNFQDRWSPYN